VLFQIGRDISEFGVDLCESEFESHNHSGKVLPNLIILDTMNKNKSFLYWLPAIVVMIIIFGFSSLPSQEMPSFGPWDLIVKKGGHMLGYGLLALAYWVGLRFDKRRWWLAFLLALIYAISDEFHQSFVPGRHPSWVDVLFFDGGGAAIALGLALWWWVGRKPN
jgi:VanZ family protein